MFRELSSGNVFTRGWHSWRDEVSGHNRRRRTFNLDRSHPIVVQVLKDHWALGDAAEANEPASTETGISTDRGVGEWEEGFTEDAHAISESAETGKTSGDDAEKSPARFLSRLFNPKS